jgi:hypothetical protein
MNLEYPLNPNAHVSTKKLPISPSTPRIPRSTSSQDLKISNLFCDLFQSHPVLGETAKSSFLKCLNFYFNSGTRCPNVDEKALSGERILYLLTQEEPRETKMDKWQKLILALIADGSNVHARQFKEIEAVRDEMLKFRAAFNDGKDDPAAECRLNFALAKKLTSSLLSEHFIKAFLPKYMNIDLDEGEVYFLRCIMANPLISLKSAIEWIKTLQAHCRVTHGQLQVWISSLEGKDGWEFLSLEDCTELLSCFCQRFAGPDDLIDWRTNQKLLEKLLFQLSVADSAFTLSCIAASPGETLVKYHPIIVELFVFLIQSNENNTKQSVLEKSACDFFLRQISRNLPHISFKDLPLWVPLIHPFSAVFKKDVDRCEAAIRLMADIFYRYSGGDEEIRGEQWKEMILMLISNFGIKTEWKPHILSVARYQANQVTKNFNSFDIFINLFGELLWAVKTKQRIEDPLCIRMSKIKLTGMMAKATENVVNYHYCVDLLIQQIKEMTEDGSISPPLFDRLYEVLDHDHIDFPAILKKGAEVLDQFCLTQNQVSAIFQRLLEEAHYTKNLRVSDLLRLLTLLYRPDLMPAAEIKIFFTENQEVIKNVATKQIYIDTAESAFSTRNIRELTAERLYEKCVQPLETLLDKTYNELNFGQLEKMDQTIKWLKALKYASAQVPECKKVAEEKYRKSMHGRRKNKPIEFSLRLQHLKDPKRLSQRNFDSYLVEIENLISYIEEKLKNETQGARQQMIDSLRDYLGLSEERSQLLEVFFVYLKYVESAARDRVTEIVFLHHMARDREIIKTTCDKLNQLLQSSTDGAERETYMNYQRKLASILLAIQRWEVIFQPKQSEDIEEALLESMIQFCQDRCYGELGPIRVNLIKNEERKIRRCSILLEEARLALYPLMPKLSELRSHILDETEKQLEKVGEALLVKRGEQQFVLAELSVAFRNLGPCFLVDDSGGYSFIE